MIGSVVVALGAASLEFGNYNTGFKSSLLGLVVMVVWAGCFFIFTKGLINVIRAMYR
jgi:hypothetical protein